MVRKSFGTSMLNGIAEDIDLPIIRSSQREIEDVPDRLRIGSLFSGAGGLDMAVEQVFGGRTVWHCELDEAASSVLAHRWPGVPNLGDITVVDWSTVEAIEILCGGFPCQDVSPAGRRAGLKDGTRSGLWAMFAEAIAALRPKVVVIENVRGLLSADGEEWPAEVVAANTEWARLARVVALIHSKINRAMREDWWHGQYKQRKQFELHRMARLRDRALARFRTVKRRLVQRAIGTVVGDLANLGYDAQWTTVSAASVGAPHKRERVIILAVDANADHATGNWQWAREEPRERGADVAAAARDGRDKGRAESAGLVGGSDAAVGGDGSAAHAACGCGTDVAGCGGAPGQYGSTEFGAGDRDRERSASARGELVGRAAAELAAVDLLPTPCAARSGNNQSASPGAAVRPSLDSITDLLPTPRRSDGDGGANPLSRAERMDDVETRIIRIFADEGGCDATSESGSRERLRDMRNSADSEAVPERATGGPDDIPEAPALLPGVREQPRGSAGGLSSLESAPGEAAGILREVRGDNGPSCTSSRPQSSEQQQSKSPGVMRDLSPQTSLGRGTCGADTEDPGIRWGKYAPAIRRWEAILGRPAPCPTEPNRAGNPRLSAEFPSWMMGWPAGWVTEVPGISRNDALRIIGNGVCPQQAAAALRDLVGVVAESLGVAHSGRTPGASDDH